MQRLLPAIIGGIFVLAPLFLQAEITLPSFFSNGMVLQRDSAAPVWGKASPNEAITLELNGQTVTATADSNGDWSGAFKGLAAGGPFTLNISGGTDKLPISNVFVGDVWLCSGQSNMAFTVAQMGALAETDLAAANDPQLRWFDPVNYIVPDPYAKRVWSDTTPESARGQSAVAFYFARQLRSHLNIPIGVINNSFPGSSIEGWMSRPAFDSLGMGPETKVLQQQWDDLDAATSKFFDDLKAWETAHGRQDPGNKGFDEGWADPKTNVSSWKTIPNMGDWSTLNLTNGGVVWIRKSIEIPPDLAGKDLELSPGYLKWEPKKFGEILGTVYFNNQQVGTIGDVLRHVFTGPDGVTIKIPGNLVVGGSNVVAIRFFTQEQKAPWNKTDLTVQTERKKPACTGMTPEWQAQVEAELPPLPAGALVSRPPVPPSPAEVRLPSIFFNSLLRPIIGYGIKGVVWYQGEANTENFSGVLSVLGKYAPVSYGRELPAMISEWRDLWKQPDLPFYIVQLPNTDTHVKTTGQPQSSDWAALRDAQLKVFKTVPNTGLIVTIDTGNGNLHPPNKKPVGERVATAALSETYGQKIEPCGPIYDSMTVGGSKIRLKFTHVGGGLVAKNGALKEFAIAGADKKFVWADVAIDGDSVVVSSPQVASPVAVRYGWLDNPTDCNFFSKDGLPASPFRTDDWPLP